VIAPWLIADAFCLYSALSVFFETKRLRAFQVEPDAQSIQPWRKLMREQQIATVIKSGIHGFLRESSEQSSSANDQVIVAWDVTYGTDGLSAYGNVSPKNDANEIDLVVVAFTSPDYNSNGQGTYYAGNFVAVGGPQVSPGTQMGFIMQSQQFTEADRGKTVVVHLQGWVNLSRYSFEKTIVIP
jgi:hypothetical protein